MIRRLLARREQAPPIVAQPSARIPRDAQPKTCRCQECGGWFKVRGDGNVRIHGLAGGRLCLGSDQNPVAEW